MFIFCELYGNRAGKRSLVDCYFVAAAESESDAQKIIEREKKYDITDTYNCDVEYVVRSERY